MTHPARYAVTFLGNGIVRLPRAGIFQTGTRAVVDETIARIAVAHGGFQVIPLTADAPAVQPVQAPAAAAAAAQAAPQQQPKPRRSQRMSAVVRVPERSEASSPAEISAADAHTR